MSVAMAPMDAANMAVAKATLGVLEVLPKMPAVRLFQDLVIQWGHSHPHPPSFGFPLPSTGPILASGCWSVLINGLPAARNGDMGLAVWCGGYFPIFELITGSSHVFIGGARASRCFMDITLHCLPDPLGGKWGIGKLDIAMAAFGAGMSTLNLAASMEQEAAASNAADALAGEAATISSSPDAEAEAAVAAAAAEAAAASAAAAGVASGTAAAQLAADVAAIAMGLLMGKDPGIGFPFGMMITGSPNVLIGGFPMPGWGTILKGLFKMFRPVLRRLQLKLPQGRLRRALCAATGHPVEVASGRMFTGMVDFEIPGHIPIIFERNYDTSSIDYEGPLGHGWIHPYDQHIRESRTQNCLIWREREGRQVRFDRLAVGARQFQPLEQVWLERISEYEYSLFDLKDKLTYHFGPVYVSSPPSLEGQHNPFCLLRITDRNGNRVECNYAGEDLSTVSNGSGTFIKFRYETFSGRNRIAEIRHHLRNGQDIGLVKFDYNDAGDLIAAVDRTYVPFVYRYSDHLMTAETNRNGLSFYFEYDGTGPNARCVRTWGDGGIFKREIEYAPAARITRVRDGLGGETVYHYDDLDLTTKIFDAEGGIVQFEYGANGECIREIDEMGRTREFSYDASLFATDVREHDGSSRRTSISPEGDVTDFTDAMGATWRYLRDDEGNVTEVIDPRGATRRYEHDVHGNIIRCVDAVGGVTELEWNEADNLVFARRPGGGIIRYTYNERDLVKELTDEASGIRHRFVYDDAGRMVKVTELNSRGETISIQRYSYDAEGNVVRYTDPFGNHYIYSYTGHNKLASRRDPLGHVRRFKFDPEERLKSITNERGDRFLIDYDLEGRVVREVGFDGGVTKFWHDLSGTLIRKEDPAGRETIFDRDAAGRVIRRLNQDGTSTEYVYDACGRVTRAINSDSAVSFEYDAAWQVITEEIDGDRVEYEYDGEMRRTARTFTSASGDAGKVRYELDVEGNYQRVEIGASNILYERNPAGDLIDRVMTNGVRERYRYDANSKLAEQAISYPPGPSMVTRTHTWDVMGSPVEVNDSLHGGRKYSYDDIQRLSRIERQDRRRRIADPREPQDRPRSRRTPPDKALWQAEQTPVSEFDSIRDVEELTYDGNGNLLERSSQVRQDRFFYEKGDKLLQKNRTEHTFDAAGNVTSKTFADGKRISYEYDIEDRLTAVTSGGERVEFRYDPFGRRTAKITSAGRTDFFWDGDVLLGESGGDRFTEYVHEGFVPLARVTGEEVEAYHTDYLGTPKEVTNASGDLIWSGTYDEYGRLLEEHGSARQPIRFQGQYEDAETGLFYNRHRYYDADDCRYISQDPIGLWGGLDFYQYTHSPVEQVDPLGLTWRPGTPKPKGWRLPKNGTWSGVPGHSDFTPTNPRDLGLAPGDVVPFKNGMPDFSGWSTRNLRVGGMTGDHATDMPKIYKQMVKVMGFPTQKAAQNWLTLNGLTPHHAGGNKVQLVPTELHDGVRHTGGAYWLRKLFQKKKNTC